MRTTDSNEVQDDLFVKNLFEGEDLSTNFGSVLPTSTTEIIAVNLMIPTMDEKATKIDLYDNHPFENLIEGEGIATPVTEPVDVVVPKPIMDAIATNIIEAHGEKFVENFIQEEKLSKKPTYLMFTAPYKLCKGECHEQEDNFEMAFPLYVGEKGKEQYRSLYPRDFNKVHHTMSDAPFKKRSIVNLFTICPTETSTEETTAIGFSTETYITTTELYTTPTWTSDSLTTTETINLSRDSNTEFETETIIQLPKTTSNLEKNTPSTASINKSQITTAITTEFLDTNTPIFSEHNINVDTEPFETTMYEAPVPSMDITAHFESETPTTINANSLFVIDTTLPINSGTLFQTLYVDQYLSETTASEISTTETTTVLETIPTTNDIPTLTTIMTTTYNIDTTSSPLTIVETPMATIQPIVDLEKGMITTTTELSTNDKTKLFTTTINPTTDTPSDTETETTFLTTENISALTKDTSEVPESYSLTPTAFDGSIQKEKSPTIFEYDIPTLLETMLLTESTTLFPVESSIPIVIEAPEQTIEITDDFTYDMFTPETDTPFFTVASPTMSDKSLPVSYMPTNFKPDMYLFTSADENSSINKPLETEASISLTETSISSTEFYIISETELHSTTEQTTDFEADPFPSKNEISESIKSDPPILTREEEVTVPTSNIPANHVSYLTVPKSEWWLTTTLTTDTETELSTLITDTDILLPTMTSMPTITKTPNKTTNDMPMTTTGLNDRKTTLLINLNTGSEVELSALTAKTEFSFTTDTGTPTNAEMTRQTKGINTTESFGFTVTTPTIGDSSIFMPEKSEMTTFYRQNTSLPTLTDELIEITNSIIDIEIKTLASSEFDTDTYSYPSTTENIPNTTTDISIVLETRSHPMTDLTTDFGSDITPTVTVTEVEIPTLTMEDIILPTTETSLLSTKGFLTPITEKRNPPSIIINSNTGSEDFFTISVRETATSFPTNTGIPTVTKIPTKATGTNVDNFSNQKVLTAEETSVTESVQTIIETSMPILDLTTILQIDTSLLTFAKPLTNQPTTDLEAKIFASTSETTAVAFNTETFTSTTRNTPITSTEVDMNSETDLHQITKSSTDLSAPFIGTTETEAPIVTMEEILSSTTETPTFYTTDSTTPSVEWWKTITTLYTNTGSESDISTQITELSLSKENETKAMTKKNTKTTEINAYDITDELITLTTEKLTETLTLPTMDEMSMLMSDMASTFQILTSSLTYEETLALTTKTIKDFDTEMSTSRTETNTALEKDNSMITTGDMPITTTEQTIDFKTDIPLSIKGITGTETLTSTTEEMFMSSETSTVFKTGYFTSDTELSTTPTINSNTGYEEESFDPIQETTTASTDTEMLTTAEKTVPTTETILENFAYEISPSEPTVTAISPTVDEISFSMSDITTNIKTDTPLLASVEETAVTTKSSIDFKTEIPAATTETTTQFKKETAMSTFDDMLFTFTDETIDYDTDISNSTVGMTAETGMPMETTKRVMIPATDISTFSITNSLTPFTEWSTTFTISSNIGVEDELFTPYLGTASLFSMETEITEQTMGIITDNFINEPELTTEMTTVSETPLSIGETLIFIPDISTISENDATLLTSAKNPTAATDPIGFETEISASTSTTNTTTAFETETFMSTNWETLSTTQLHLNIKTEAHTISDISIPTTGMISTPTTDTGTIFEIDMSTLTGGDKLSEKIKLMKHFETDTTAITKTIFLSDTPTTEPITYAETMFPQETKQLTNINTEPSVPSAEKPTNENFDTSDTPTLVLEDILTPTTDLELKDLSKVTTIDIFSSTADQALDFKTETPTPKTEITVLVTEYISIEIDTSVPNNNNHLDVETSIPTPTTETELPAATNETNTITVIGSPDFEIKETEIDPIISTTETVIVPIVVSSLPATKELVLQTTELMANSETETYSSATNKATVFAPETPMKTIQLTSIPVDDWTKGLIIDIPIYVTTTFQIATLTPITEMPTNFVIEVPTSFEENNELKTEIISNIKTTTSDTFTPITGTISTFVIEPPLQTTHEVYLPLTEIGQLSISDTDELSGEFITESSTELSESTTEIVSVLVTERTFEMPTTETITSFASDIPTPTTPANDSKTGIPISTPEKASMIETEAFMPTTDYTLTLITELYPDFETKLSTPITELPKAFVTLTLPSSGAPTIGYDKNTNTADEIIISTTEKNTDIMINISTPVDSTFFKTKTPTLLIENKSENVVSEFHSLATESNSNFESKLNLSDTGLNTDSYTETSTLINKPSYETSSDRDHASSESKTNINCGKIIDKDIELKYSEEENDNDPNVVIPEVDVEKSTQSFSKKVEVPEKNDKSLHESDYAYSETDTPVNKDQKNPYIYETDDEYWNNSPPVVTNSQSVVSNQGSNSTISKTITDTQTPYSKEIEVMIPGVEETDEEDDYVSSKTDIDVPIYPDKKQKTPILYETEKDSIDNVNLENDPLTFSKHLFTEIVVTDITGEIIIKNFNYTVLGTVATKISSSISPENDNDKPFVSDSDRGIFTTDSSESKTKNSFSFYFTTASGMSKKPKNKTNIQTDQDNHNDSSILIPDIKIQFNTENNTHENIEVSPESKEQIYHGTANDTALETGKPDIGDIYSDIDLNSFESENEIKTNEFPTGTFKSINTYYNRITTLNEYNESLFTENYKDREKVLTDKFYYQEIDVSKPEIEYDHRNRTKLDDNTESNRPVVYETEDYKDSKYTFPDLDWSVSKENGNNEPINDDKEFNSLEKLATTSQETYITNADGIICPKLMSGICAKQTI